MVKMCDINKGKVKVALATYGKEGQLLFHLDRYTKKKAALKAIRKIPRNLRFKKADLAVGLRLVREQIFVAPFDRTDAKNYLIIVTDSPSYGVNEVIAREAQSLKDLGVHIYMIGVGNVDDEELLLVPSEPSAQNSQKLGSYKELPKFQRTGKRIMKQIPACEFLC